MVFRPFTADEVKFRLGVEPDDTPIQGSFCGSTEEETRAMEEDTKRAAEESVWGWAVVTVSATWDTLLGVDTLGGCSYESEEDFLRSGADYYQDMRANALADLNKQAERLYDKLTARVNPSTG